MSIFVCLSALYASATLVGFLSVWHVIPTIYIYFSILISPWLIYFYLVINIQIAKFVILQQQTMVFYLWVLLFYGCMLMEYRQEEHFCGFVIMWGISCCTFFATPLLDSVPFELRIIFNKIFIPFFSV